MVSSPRSKPAFLPPRNDQQLLSLGYISKICSSLTTIKYCLSKSFAYHQKLSKKSRPNSSTLLLLPGRLKNIPWSLVWAFFSMSCISNVFTEFLLRWHSQILVQQMVEDGLSWISLRTCFAHGLSLANKEVNKWCHRHAWYVIQPCRFSLVF